jgi:hypothetical protein
MSQTMNVGGAGAFAAIAMVCGLCVTIFYMVCAWRAMRALEKMANSAEEISRKQH